MGPRSFDRGNHAEWLTVEQVAALQWGRDLLIAEIGTPRDNNRAFIMLQWGRDLLIAEILKEYSFMR